MDQIQFTRNLTDEEVGDILLASLAYDPQWRDKVLSEIGQWGFFPTEKQQVAFDLMRSMHLSGQGFNGVDIGCALYAMDYQDSRVYLTQLEFDRFGGETSLSEACKRIVHYAKHKSMSQIIGEKLEEAENFEQDVAVSASELARSLEEIEKSPSVSFHSMSDATESVIRELNEPESKGRIVPTPLPELNKIIQGFHPGDYIVIAGSTSAGKTSLAIGCSKHYAERGGTVLYYVLDQRAEDMSRRLATAYTGKQGYELTPKDMAIFRSENRVMAERFLFHAPKSANVEEFGDACRRGVKQNGVGLIVLDHLGQIQSKGRTNGRYELMTNVSHQIKRIGIELDVPILVLCQLNRTYQDGNVDVEKDRYPRPRLNHLRDSGAIEQDANVVILLHNKLKLIEAREGTESKEYREYLSKHVKGDRVPVEIIVAKNKDGETSTIPYLFHSKTMTFVAGVENKREDPWQNR